MGKRDRNTVCSGATTVWCLTNRREIIGVVPQGVRYLSPTLDSLEDLCWEKE